MSSPAPALTPTLPPAPRRRALDAVRREPPQDWVAGARGAFERWISDDSYPCVMAKSVVKTGQYVVRPYAGMDDARSARRLAADLAAYVLEPEPDRGVRSFLAVFKQPADPVDEAEFERLFWATLGHVHHADGHPWDPSVSPDPAHPEFSFSVGGRAFYVVGMHPGASRQARRFPRPLIAFNLHSQFEDLRASGRYAAVRDTIRARDLALQGSVNPSLQDFGTQSEARQYAGRAVGAEWRCPFHPAPPADDAEPPATDPPADAR